MKSKRKKGCDKPKMYKKGGIMSYAKGGVMKSKKNKPTNPSLWSKAISKAKQKFDVYPSAYANAWAAKWYKGQGGSWKKA